jgi:hypothetical protein
MAELSMGRKKNAPPAHDGPGVEKGAAADEEPETTLKVYASTQQLVSKTASLCGVKIAKLFKVKEVEDFLVHFYLDQLRREQEAAKRGRPQ